MSSFLELSESRWTFLQRKIGQRKSCDHNKMRDMSEDNLEKPVVVSCSKGVGQF